MYVILSGIAVSVIIFSATAPPDKIPCVFPLFTPSYKTSCIFPAGNFLINFLCVYPVKLQHHNAMYLLNLSFAHHPGCGMFENKIVTDQQNNQIRTVDLQWGFH